MPANVSSVRRQGRVLLFGGYVMW
uniref:Uncharacterized protein n=1 Tax=Anguilla anguilla TaxID=7936 RepID=A0A0E9SKG5_ANGAN